MDILKQKWFPPTLIIFSIFLFLGLKSLKNEPIKEEFVNVSPLVKVSALNQYNGGIKVHGTGAVRSISEVMLSPQVSGVITSIGKHTSAGSSFKKGDVLFQVEQADYLYRLQAAKAEVARQEVLLKSEEYESEIARQEWDEYSEGSDEKASPLTLREPQLNMAKANLEAAKANYNMAKLNLNRTKVKAPYNGQVKQRFVDQGQFVAPGTNLASIFNSDESQIRISVQPRDLRWVSEGQKVVIFYEGKEWTGRVKTVGSNLDSKTRLATITVVVDPAEVNTSTLLNGAFVDVEILGKKEKDTYEIERHLIKDNETIWVYSDGKLDIRKVNVLYHGKHFSYINLEMNKGDELIISQIETPIHGMKLRTR